jgi:hypothetical protein
MTTWKPTESLKRADELASTIHCDIVQAGGNVTTLARHRLVQLLEAAIDKALADGHRKAMVDTAHYDLPNGWRRDEEGLIHAGPPATADPVGLSTEGLREFLYPGTPNEEMLEKTNGRWPPPVDMLIEEADAADLTVELRPGVADLPKKRGRPKGKGKKAKKAKVKKDLGREIEAQVETPSDPPLGEAPAS